MFALLEGAVGDLAQQAGVMLQRADMAPVHFVGAGVEMIVAERGEAGQLGVDLGLPADEGGKRGLLVWNGEIAAGEERSITLKTSLRWPDGMMLTPDQ